jgi:hypothetical protein
VDSRSHAGDLRRHGSHRARCVEGVEKLDDVRVASWEGPGTAPHCHIARQSEGVYYDDDLWWDPLHPSSTVIPRVGGCVRSSALPFFDERFVSLEAVLEYLERDYLSPGRPRAQRLRVLTPDNKIMAMRIRLSRGEREAAEAGFIRLCRDRAAAKALGLPEGNPRVQSLLESVALDAGFAML